MLTTPDRERGEGDHLWPEFLPGGGAVLFTITPADGSIDDAQIALLDLQTRTWKPLNLIGSHAQYVPTGHLIYGVAGTLRAVPFDLERLEVRGTPKPVLEGVVTTIEGAADITLAANGSLVYVPGMGGIVPSRTVMSVDRHGNASPLPGLLPDTYRDVRLSPDGARLALATQSKVWTYDFERTTLSPLTSDPARSLSPLWTADGQRVVFTSFRAGYPELFWRPHDGSGSDERLLTRAKDLLNVRADDWSRDGKYLLFTESWPSGQAAIGQMAIARPSDVKVLVKSKLRNAVANVSPDGLWIAYESSESGQLEIYVERYPQLGSKKKISTGSGRLPIWSRDGRELFFSSLDGRQMFAVAVQPGVAPVIGRPEVLFEFTMLRVQGSFRPYDVARDGRFLIIRSAQAEAGDGTSSNLILVQNWFEELSVSCRPIDVSGVPP